MKKSLSLVAFSLAAAASLTACTDSTSAGAKSASERIRADWPSLTSSVDRDPALEKRIDELLTAMTNAEKVGQVIQPELRHITPDQVREYHIGSILNGGGSFPQGNKQASIDDWLALADAFYAASMDASDGHQTIPIMWGTDAVHGHNNVIGATLFPHNVGLGAAHDPELIEEINTVTAREVAVTGIDWNFSPTVAVARDDRWGRAYESYSENPELVQAYAGRAVQGLQGSPGDDFLGAGHVIATAKHFVGDGGTGAGVDRGDVVITEESLRDIHAPGYFTAIEAGVQTVMASFNSWQGEKLHGHRYLLTDVLKNQLGFDGLVVGDWNGHAFVDGCSLTSCPQALNAGVDIFMAPEDWRELYSNTLDQVAAGVISQSRLDDAVRRVLRVKLRAGLFDKGMPSRRPFAGRADLLGAAKHRDVARRAVRQSLVLLKNNQNLLPLALNRKVLVAGDGAHNIGKQAGGWTLSWQGTGNTRDDFPGATSIYEGISEIVEAAGGKAELSEDGRYDSRPDVAIVVFGEDPYAEMQGDLSHLDYSSDQDLALLQRLRAAGIPVVSVFLTGRPLWVNPEINASDAFVVAWLPGSEGGGVADVLFRNAEGEVIYDFTGRLPFSWPGTAVQTPLNIGQADYKPLFPYGFGLSYADAGESVAQLSEESGLSTTDGNSVLSVFRDRALAPWTTVIGDESRRSMPVSGSGASLPGISIKPVDRNVQEDSRRVQWTGTSDARVGFFANERTDLEPYAESGGVLIVNLQILRAPSESVHLGMECGQDCGAEVDVTSALRDLQEEKWQSLAVSLQCFSTPQMDFSLVLSPFYLRSEGEMDLSLHHVRIEPSAKPDLRCD
ncbi:glycoside hydrolase family 3 protein [Proteobacteria bacterium 005FR1]|nr:glycoside hydrolase family 3 protein [Proteobacteria bacterium 005FR1]